MNIIKLFVSNYLRWIAGTAFAVVIAFAGVQTVRVAGLKTDLALEQKARSDETAARMQVALDHAAEIKRLTTKHAEQQQEKESDYVATIQKLEADKRAGAATAGRLRDQLAAVSASGRRPGETDAAVNQRTADRLSLVSTLLAESIDLVTEGRAVIERRDIEVKRLLDQIGIDRAACSP